MNREIKFRAWDKAKKEWLCGYEMPNLGGFSLFGETIILGEWSRILDEYTFEKNGHKQDDLVVMQYTGLKDRKGVEIYEGDIVKLGGNMFGTYAIEYGDIEDGHGEGIWGIGFNITKSMAEICEVIGNIYSNPELLEANKKLK